MVNFVQFPELLNANEDGLLASGGDLSADTLVSAYSQGIFPWFSDDQPILWWSPDPRLVLYPAKVKISRSLRKLINKGTFEIRCNTAFADVIFACSRSRLNQTGEDTWITDDMQQAYINLHQQGYAHSIEAWQNDTLVGGLYGLALGNVFFGESMFSHASNASKVALATLCNVLQQRGFAVIDCQVSSEHLISLGAVDIPRSEFVSYLTNIDIQNPDTAFAKLFMKYV